MNRILSRFPAIFFFVVVQTLHGQQPPERKQASRMIVDVERTSKPSEFRYKVNGKRVKDNDIIGFLTKNRDQYKADVVPCIVIPATLSIYDIGAMEATFDLIGYHVVRFFLQSKVPDSMQEIKFEEPVPSETIRGTNSK